MNVNRAGSIYRQANMVWGPMQVRGDRSNFQIVRLPVGPAQLIHIQRYRLEQRFSTFMNSRPTLNVGFFRGPPFKKEEK